MEAASGEGANGFVGGFLPGVGAGGKKTGGKSGGGAIGALVGGLLGTLIGGYDEYMRQDRLPETFRFPGEAPLGEVKLPSMWETIEDYEKRKLERDFNNLPGPFNNEPCP